MTEQAQQPAPVAPPAARRTGPRPLPLHLGLALLTLQHSRAALPIWREGWPDWNPSLATTAADLRQAIRKVPADEFAAAVDAAGVRRLSDLFDGILAWRHHPWHRDLPEPPVIWRDGTTRLLDYGDGDGAPVLVIPSLVNRAWILDLRAESSLLRWLAGAGLRPLLVDWDAPGEVERGFGLTGYVAGRLAAALDVATGLAGGPVPVFGYCMGGTLAVGLAALRPDAVRALALLAAPWDFHAGETFAAEAMTAALAPLLPVFDGLGEMPVDFLQALFAGLDPYLSIRKFQAFARLDQASRKAIAFVALEDWVNDGVPLAAPVARETILGWYRDNLPARGEWRLDGRPVRPENFAGPALVVTPGQDRIVPPESALALAHALPRVEVLKPAMGHVGMIVGGGAPERVWRPLAGWLAEAAGS